MSDFKYGKSIGKGGRLKPSGNWRQVRVARIGKPHGIRGEVTVEVFTDAPDLRFDNGSSLSVRFPEGHEAPFDALTVEKARWNKKILLLKFYEFADRNTAEKFRNAELYVSASVASAEEEGWYPHDLVGFTVHLGSVNAEKIGEVSDLLTGEVQDLLQVKLLDGSEALVPFVEEIVPEIDEGTKALTITPPPGLLELNQD